MPNTILLDPTAGSPGSIAIGGTCYGLVGTTSAAPDTSSFDSSSSDCGSCLCCTTVDTVTWDWTGSNHHHPDQSATDTTSGSSPGDPTGLEIVDNVEPNFYGAYNLTCNAGVWTVTRINIDMDGGDGPGSTDSVTVSNSLYCDGDVVKGTFTDTYTDPSTGYWVSVTVTLS